ncbi:hypothetical protein ACFE04_027581 [Oxalis oulophora]
MDDGSVIHPKLTINVNKVEGIFDFSGTSTEVYGNLNAPEAVTAAVIYCLRCLVDVDIPLNQGCLPLVKTHSCSDVVSHKVFMGSSSGTNLLSPVNFDSWMSEKVNRLYGGYGPIETKLSFSDAASQKVSMGFTLYFGKRFLFSALGGLLYGFDIGATSCAAIFIQSLTLSGISWYDLSSVDIGHITSGSLYGTLIGSALAFTIADFLGRALVTGIAPDFPVMVIGQFVYGIGIGLAMHAALMYIAETAPSQIRGRLISLKEFFMILGVVVALHVFGHGNRNVVARWLLLRAIQGEGDMKELRERATSCLCQLRDEAIGDLAPAQTAGFSAATDASRVLILLDLSKFSYVYWFLTFLPDSPVVSKWQKMTLIRFSNMLQEIMLTVRYSGYGPIETKLPLSAGIMMQNRRYVGYGPVETKLSFSDAMSADMLEVANNGSKLKFQFGAFRVGPELVGAHPGPVCCRKGGQLAITDANLVLEFLIPDYFPSIFDPKENQPLDIEATRKEFEKLAIQVNSYRKAEGIFDFSGTSTEVYGNLNAPEAVTAAVIYCLRCLADVDIPLNQGCLALVKTNIPAVETKLFFSDDVSHKVFMGSSSGTNLLSPVNFDSWMIFDIPTGISKGQWCPNDMMMLKERKSE